MGRIDNDMDIKEKMQKEIELPVTVEEGFEEVYRKIRQGEVHMKGSNRNIGKKKRYRTLGIAAAAACMILALTGVLYANPALAKDIPLIGDVFAKILEMREQSPYPDKDKTAYQSIAEHAESVTSLTSTAESEGITMSVSDAYCDGYDLYFTFSLQTDDEELNQADYLYLLTYWEDEHIPYWAGATINDKEVYPSEVLTVKKAEDGTFAGLIRISYLNMEDEKFPEDMTVGLNIQAVGAHKMNEEADPDVKYFSRTGYKCVDGSWKIQFKPAMDTSNNRTAAPNVENNGFIVQEITQTPSNTHITLYLPAEWAAKNPAAAVTDSDGNRIYQETAKIVEQEDGSQIQYMVLDHSEADQFVMKIYDKNAGTEEDGLPRLIAEIPFSME